MGIKIREKELKSGRKSLYLDIHHNGEREYEFLGLYLTGDSAEDKETRRKAEIIKGKYLEKIVNDQYGIDSNMNQNASFYDFFQKIVDRNLDKGINNHQSVMKHLKAYHKPEKLRFKDITKSWGWGFREYLLDKFDKQNTAHNYFTIFNAALNKAVKHEIIPKNPIKEVDNIGAADVVRDFLTTDELQKLIKTDCRDPEVKRAFLFSCNTGLRYSDVDKVQWKEVQDDRIAFDQKKTTKVNYVPLNKSARKLMGEAGNPTAKVFNLPSYNNVWDVTRQWGEAAKLGKHLHFHMSRHTFATQLLNNGADIYTVSKLLGVSLKTAEIYTKIIDKTKEDAVNKLPEINLEADTMDTSTKPSVAEEAQGIIDEMHSEAEEV